MDYLLNLDYLGNPVLDLFLDGNLNNIENLRKKLVILDLNTENIKINFIIIRNKYVDLLLENDNKYRLLNLLHGYNIDLLNIVSYQSNINYTPVGVNKNKINEVKEILNNVNLSSNNIVLLKVNVNNAINENQLLLACNNIINNIGSYINHINNFNCDNINNIYLINEIIYIIC